MYKLKYWARYPEVTIKIPHVFATTAMVVTYGNFIKSLAHSMANDANNDPNIYLDLVSTKEEKEVIKDWAERCKCGATATADLMFDNSISEKEAEVLRAEAGKQETPDQLQLRLKSQLCLFEDALKGLV